MRSLPWFRFYPEHLTDPRFHRIAREAGLPWPQVIGVWTALLCLAARSPCRGSLHLTPTQPYALDDLAQAAGLDPDCAAALLKSFTRYDLLTLENHTFAIADWSEHQYESDSSTERVRRHRLSRETPG